VGYGDISPRTDIGQAIAAVIMILGYGIIAVPTGIVTVELSHAANTLHVGCHCGATWHDADAVFCKRCGTELKGGDEAESGDDVEGGDED
jgi:voltage-gated potassium channel